MKRFALSFSLVFLMACAGEADLAQKDVTLVEELIASGTNLGQGTVVGGGSGTTSGGTGTSPGSVASGGSAGTALDCNALLNLTEFEAKLVGADLALPGMAMTLEQDYCAIKYTLSASAAAQVASFAPALDSAASALAATAFAQPFFDAVVLASTLSNGSSNVFYTEYSSLGGAGGLVAGADLLENNDPVGLSKSFFNMDPNDASILVFRY